MLTLLTYPAGFGQFSLSPFCTKAAYLLALSGQPWQRGDLKDPRKMPHSKLPVLKTPQRLIADSDNIRNWLEDQGAVFDPDLSDIQRAQSRALIRMAEEHLYFHLVMDRWGNDDVWPTVREIYFSDIPRVLRGFVTNRIRKSSLAGLNMQGISRYTPQERTHRLELDLDAISTHLWQSPFLMGSVPTGADISVAAILGAMRSTPVETPLQQRIAKDAQLSDYVDRMNQAVPLI